MRGVGALLLLLFAAVAFATPGPDDEHIAANFGPEVVHGIRDLLVFMGPEGFAQGEQDALLSSGESTYNDRIVLARRGWTGEYRFLGDAVRMVGDMGVFPAGSAARESFDSYQRFVLGVLEKQGLFTERIGGPRVAGRDGDYFLLRNAEGLPHGNLFVVSTDRRWYGLLVSGVRFETVEDIEAFLEPKLTRFLSFEPDLGGRTHGEILIKPLTDHLQTLSYVVLVALIIVYWLVRAVIGLVNRSRKARPISGRTVGVVTVCALSFAAMGFGFWLTLRLPPDLAAALDPVELGRLEGSATAVGLVPLLFILTPIGIAALVRRKPDLVSRPPG